MKYAYDLHIHSILSPDADVLMTPNNIFNMAMLKKMDIIAITDHNSMAQLKICSEIAQSYDILFVPGVELSLADHYHVLCYFETLEEALAFDHILKRYRTHQMMDGKNEMIQGITDIHDHVIDHVSDDLSNDLSLSLLELLNHLRTFRHLLVFAHIDRLSSSGINVLPHPLVHAIEMMKPHADLIKKHHLDDYLILYNSDAHDITMIKERTEQNMIELPSLSITSLFEVIKRG